MPRRGADGAPRRTVARDALRRGAGGAVAERCAARRAARHGVPRRTAPRRAAAVARMCVGANSLRNWHGKCFTSGNAHKYSPLNIITCNWPTTGQSFIYSSNNYWEHFAHRDVHARSCPDKNEALESTSVALEP